MGLILFCKVKRRRNSVKNIKRGPKAQRISSMPSQPTNGRPTRPRGPITTHIRAPRGPATSAPHPRAKRRASRLPAAPMGRVRTTSSARKCACSSSPTHGPRAAALLQSASGLVRQVGPSCPQLSQRQQFFANLHPPRV